MEVEEWIDLFLFRPLGFLVAYPLVKTPISPNFITLLSGIVGVAGAWFILYGNWNGLYIGAILYLLSNVLDCTDGQLARLKQQYSRYGRIYDGVADYVVGLTVFLAIGFGCRPENYSIHGWWLLVFFGGFVSTTYQGMHLNHVREAYLRARKKNHSGTTKSKKKNRKKQSGWKKALFLPLFLLYRLYVYSEFIVRKRVRVPAKFVQKNNIPILLKIALIMWTFTGKGSHTILLGVCLLLNRPQSYFWITLIAGNLWVLLTWTVHVWAVYRAQQASESSTEIMTDAQVAAKIRYRLSRRFRRQDGSQAA